MKTNDLPIPLLGRACAVSLFLLLPVSANGTLESLVADSRAAMTAKDWQQALDLSETAISDYGGEGAFLRYGAQFGVIYYRKGLCEMKLGLWKEAMESFETCYRNFPNVGAADGNPYQKMALRKRAESAMGAGEWQLAIDSFAKFIAERDKERDSFPQGSYYINLAICHYKLGNIAKGSENLEIAIRNKRNFPTPDTDIVAGFQSLVSAAIAAGDEQALLDFIRKNRGALQIQPYELYSFSPVFMKLAGDAIATGMRRAALELYQFIPSTDVAIDDVRAHLKSMGNAEAIKDGAVTLKRAVLEADLATFEADRRGKRATESIKLAAVAFLHEASGNLLGAYAAYLQLETYFPTAEQREENLFNLVRVAGRVGMVAESRAHADLFMKSFPESRHLPEAHEIVLSTFLDGEDTAGCIAVAGAMLDTLKPGTPEHETCLHLLATAMFRTGDHDQAGPMLDRLVELYPQGAHAVEAAYLQASNTACLHQWEKAAGLFDAFLSAHPDNPWSAPARQQRAACDIELGNPQAARKRLTDLIRDFPDDPAAGQAWLQLGRIEASSGNVEAAEIACSRALEIAKRHADRAQAGDTLCALVELSADGSQNPERMKRAAAHADEFWNNHAGGSPWRTRVAIAQVPALLATGRSRDAVQRIRDILADPGTEPASKVGLIDAHARAFLATHSADELEKEMVGFPGIDPDDKSLQANVRMTLIRAFESEAENAKDEDRQQHAAAMVRSLYQQLKTGFTPVDLDTPALVRLADHLRLKTSTPREALPLYEEALIRNDARWTAAATLGLADIRARSADSAEAALGMEGFNQVYLTATDPDERGYALSRMVETSMAQGDFAKAAATATTFLESDPGKSSMFAPQIALLRARSFQELGNIEEAIDAYQQLWSGHTATLGVSAPAMLAWMRLLWARDAATDHQTAYEKALAYLAETRVATTGMSESDLAPWRTVEQEVKTFATSPGIRPSTDSKP